ncbi:MAG: hypothetical protein Q9214_003614, partial [Letrouitia sp. 1 TL-2023]
MAQASPKPPHNEQLWAKALSQWSQELGKKEMQKINQTPSYESLQKSIVSAKKIYKERTIPQLLERLDPFFDRLASRFKDVLLSIVEMFEKIETSLPRFEIYLKAFPESKRVENATLELYTEIVRFLFNGSIIKIKECKDAIELEAFAANIEGTASRHEELKSLLVNQDQRVELNEKIPCHVILFPRNSRFYGRTEVLDKIEKYILDKRSCPEQRSLAILGLGGVGKTQLVLEFVWQHVKDIQVILWSQADSASHLQQSFDSFARRLGIFETDKGLNVLQTVQIVKQWFEQT